jgi:hypothetical protein
MLSRKPRMLMVVALANEMARNRLGADSARGNYRVAAAAA